MAVTINFYPSFKQGVLTEEHNVLTDTLKVVLLGTGGGYSTAHDQLADISAAELANGNGYATGGQALASRTLTLSSGNAVFDGNDTEWVASGAAITAHHAVIYNDTVTGDELVAHLNFGTGGVTVPDGGTLRIKYNALGIFKLT